MSDDTHVVDTWTQAFLMLKCLYVAFAGRGRAPITMGRRGLKRHEEYTWGLGVQGMGGGNGGPDSGVGDGPGAGVGVDAAPSRQVSRIKPASQPASHPGGPNWRPAKPYIPAARPAGRGNAAPSVLPAAKAGGPALSALPCSRTHV